MHNRLYLHLEKNNRKSRTISRFLQSNHLGNGEAKEGSIQCTIETLG